MTVLDTIRSRRGDAHAAAYVDHLCQTWRIAAIGAGIGRTVLTPSGPTDSTPHVVDVTIGPPTRFTVALLPAQTADDVRRVASRLAEALGAVMLRVSPAGFGHARLELLDRDPLAGTVGYPLPVPDEHVGFGVDETGQVVACPLDELTHVAVQGSTGGGKSAAGYSLLAQLRRSPVTEVVGIDPTGRLLGPWGPHPAGCRVTGTRDAAERYPAVLRALVDEMDERIAALPARADALPITPTIPLRVTVLEELPAISRLTGFKTSGAPSETQRLIGRIAAEGRKVGYRLVVIGQRLGADVLDTATRDQLLTRMTFVCRDLATLRMLSPDAGADDLVPLAGSPPGVALMEMPGMTLRRVRGPWVGSYSRYYDLITTAAA